MKLLFIFILLSLSPNVVSALGFPPTNPDCPFSEMELIEYTINLHTEGTPYLIDSTTPIIDINFKVRGNHTNTDESIEIYLEIFCDKEHEASSKGMNVKRSYDSTKDITTLYYNRDFSLDPERKKCRVEILFVGVNETWSDNEIKDDKIFKCKIMGLNDKYETDDITVISFSDFLELEKMERDFARDIMFVSIAIFTGLLGIFASLLAQEHIFKRNIRKERAEKLYSPLYDEISSILKTIKDFSVSFPDYEWRKIKESHIGYLIHKKEIEKKLEEFYEEKVLEFRDDVRSCEEELRRFTEEDLMTKLNKSKIDEHQGRNEAWLKNQVINIRDVAYYILNGKIPEDCNKRLTDCFEQGKEFLKLEKINTIEEYLKFLIRKTKTRAMVRYTKSKQKSVIKNIEELLKILEKEKKI